MSYQSAAAVINADGVRQQVRVALVAFALGVMGEASSPQHVARVALAQKVLLAPDDFVEQFALAIIASNQAAASDAAIDAGLATTWNALAGVSVNP